ncbi:MAG: thioesterase family protein [Pirellulales bacterium]
MIHEHEIEIRVRYNETDGQGRVHHAQYLNYFERGRVELLRQIGFSYKDFEATGLMLVVTKMEIQYFFPAEFDDLLHQTTRVVRSKGVRIHHAYKIEKDSTLLVTGHSEIACIDREGNVRRLPDYLQMKL